jgi:hypothetical protein
MQKMRPALSKDEAGREFAGRAATGHERPDREGDRIRFPKSATRRKVRRAADLEFAARLPVKSLADL